MIIGGIGAIDAGAGMKIDEGATITLPADIHREQAKALSVIMREIERGGCRPGTYDSIVRALDVFAFNVIGVIEKRRVAGADKPTAGQGGKPETPESFEARVARIGYAEACRGVGTQEAPPNPMLTSYPTADYRLVVNDFGKAVRLDRMWKVGQLGQEEWRAVPAKFLAGGTVEATLSLPHDWQARREKVLAEFRAWADKLVDEILGLNSPKPPNQS